MITSITPKELKKLPVIGKGLFTKCRQLNEKTVLLQTTDPLKECYSMGWIDSRFFPKYSKVDCNVDEQVFACKKYDRPKSLKAALLPSEYKKYITLKTVWNDVGVVSAIKFTNALSKVDKKLAENIRNAVEALMNYVDENDLRFEISPRNVAVDKGKLVLLDCFFSNKAEAKARK